MSKITLAPNAAGTATFTVAAPGTSTDRTLTLPDETTTLVGNTSLAGMVAYFAMNTAPSGWLKANGAAVSRTTYAGLFTAIGTTFGAGDGSTTFNLPDMRGEFARGWDDGRGVDSGRVFGSAQSDAFQGHWHGINVSSTVVGNNGGGGVGTGNLRADGVGTAAQARAVSTNGTDGTPRTAAETRPRNIALLACIKY